MKCLDVSDARSIDGFVNELGKTPVSVLINNAGIFVEGQDTLETLVPCDMMRQFTVNAVAPLLVSRGLLPCLELAENPKIINISSQLGSIADCSSGSYYGYRASKVALNMFTKNMSIELAPKGIAVVSLHPGYVKTDMTGGKGDVSATQAAQEMVATIDGIDISATGSFLNRTGKVCAW